MKSEKKGIFFKAFKQFFSFCIQTVNCTERIRIMMELYSYDARPDFNLIGF